MYMCFSVTTDTDTESVHLHRVPTERDQEPDLAVEEHDDVSN